MDMLHLIVNCETLHCVWHILEQALTSSFNPRIMQLDDSFQDLRQGGHLGTIYLHKAKALFDELIAADRPFSLMISIYTCSMDFGVSLKT
jgi:hypothetical protein